MLISLAENIGFDALMQVHHGCFVSSNTHAEIKR